MPSPLEALQALTLGPNYGKRTPLLSEDYGWAGDVPTQGELSSPFEREKTARASQLESADRSRIAGINEANDKAILSGFGGSTVIGKNPEGIYQGGSGQTPSQRMGQTLREQEMQKAYVPLEQSQETGRTQRAIYEQQGANQRAIELLKEKAATERAHDALKQMLQVPLGENDTISLPGGGSIKHGSTPFPTGPAGVNLETLIQKRMNMEKPAQILGSEGLGSFFGAGPQDTDKAAVERALDAQFPQWRQRMDPGFKFATPGAAPHPTPSAPTGAAGIATTQAGGQDPLTQQAVQILQQGGHPVTPANIEYVKSQLGR